LLKIENAIGMRKFRNAENAASSLLSAQPRNEKLKTGGSDPPQKKDPGSECVDDATDDVDRRRHTKRACPSVGDLYWYTECRFRLFR
jgi:hypothetical protein